MPSIVSSHLYTFLAVALVGMLLVSTFSSYALAIRRIPENEHLKNLLNSVAAKGFELSSLVKTTGIYYCSAQVTIHMPSSIGNHEYWIRISNDTSKSWVEGGLGKMWNGASENRVFFSERFSANGYYIGGRGLAVLQCYLNNSEIQLNLSSIGES